MTDHPLRHAPSAATIEAWLLAQFAAACQVPVEAVDAHTPVTELGIESLALFSLAGDLASWLDRDIEVTMLWEFPTIAAVAAHLGATPGAPDVLDEEATAPPKGACLVTIRDGGGEMPLFCVHDATGQVWCYTWLALELDRSRPVYGFRAPSLDDENFSLGSIEELAAHYVAHLRHKQPHGPYLLAGFSLGGLIALEMARLLYEQGEEVRRLILLDTAFPGVAWRPVSLSRRWTIHLRHLWMFRGDWLFREGRLKRYWLLNMWYPLKEALHMGGETLQEYNARQLTDSRTWAELCRALNDYHARPYEGHLTFARARWTSDKNPHSRLWQGIARGGFDCFSLPTSHSYIMLQPQVSVLGRHVERLLREDGAATP